MLDLQARPGRYYHDLFTFEQRYDIMVEVVSGDEPCTEIDGGGGGAGNGDKHGPNHEKILDVLD